MAVGLFGRKAKEPAPPPAAPPRLPPAAPSIEVDPLAAIVGSAVDESAYEDGLLSLTFKGAAGDAHLEAYGQCEFSEGGKRHARGTPGFDAAVAAARGRRVLNTQLKMGEALVIQFEGGLNFVASLAQGTYPGTSAVYLKGPGRSHANYNENGIARLTF
jgi:hypothetical protein